MTRWKLGFGVCCGVILLILFAPGMVFAEEGVGEIDSGDTAWMIAASALVLIMTPGLAFFYGGLVRRKNILSVLMQCFICMALMTVLWVVVGYSIAFGDSVGGFFGNPLTYFFLNGVGLTPREGHTIPHNLFMIFQCMFAIITPALILGAFAERLKFGPFCLFMSIWLLVVYCPVAHWAWGGGFYGGGDEGSWLMKAGTGALDFAGGTVVHINAGIAALVAALILGKRQGFPGKISPPHNLPFAVLGASLLWFGWFGFNAGSALAADAIAANAFVVTHIAAATAALTWAVIDRICNGKPTVLGVITGAVAGLVAITPACGYVGVMGALGIGMGAGVFAFLAVVWLKPKLGYDDSLDVFGVHGVAGIWGAIATGIWAVEGIGGTAGNGGQVWIQIKAVVCTIVWSFVVSYILWKVIDSTIGLRATEHNERVGLDLTEHAETAYTVME
ncbi:MAG: ammonium transporter [Planctomycetes bacterium]|nr:ammonium transporter [Planctomycetota bacterium]